jgi:uncharacterized membrane protein YpjA
LNVVVLERVRLVWSQGHCLVLQHLTLAVTGILVTAAAALDNARTDRIEVVNMFEQVWDVYET